MLRYRIAVGHEHHVKPANIVGAIANEAGLDSQYIGRIDIFDNYSLVDLPEGMPRSVFNDLKDVWVSGQKMKITLHGKHDKTGKAASPGKTTTTRRKAPAGKPGGTASRRKNLDGSKPPVRKKKVAARAKPAKRPAKAGKKKLRKTNSR